MSAGIFNISRYSADYGGGTQIHPIRVQPETLAAVCNSETNDPPVGATNNPISAITSRGRRAKGLIPRTVTVRFPLTGEPTGYLAGGITKIPALTSIFYDACTPGSDITYLGVTCTVVGRSPERAS